MERLRLARVRPLVLIVEDQEELRRLHTWHLLRYGFDALEAADGLDAVDTTTTRAPDVVLIDLRLPVLNSREATRRLKADARTAHIPVVALTACDGSLELERATSAGCDWFVPKPCPPDALVAEIERILGRQ